HESFVNPAKSLALRLAERTPLLWGTDPVATAVAGHAAGALAAHAGVVAHAAGFHEAAVLPALWQEAVRAGVRGEVFRDPFEDSPDRPELRPVLLGVHADRQLERSAAMRAVPSADVVTADEELMVRQGEPGALACAAAVLAVRFDLAALYLGLGRGVLGGPGWGGSSEPTGSASAIG
ncbi:MAG: SIS domain-containing protein, partial [Pseudonocardiaceae bacterium]